jgi:hypothetical protein
MTEILDDWEDWNPSNGTFLQHCFAGSLAGLSEHLVMYPVDSYKVSMKVVLWNSINIRYSIILINGMSLLLHSYPLSLYCFHF